MCFNEMQKVQVYLVWHRMFLFLVLNVPRHCWKLKQCLFFCQDKGVELLFMPNFYFHCIIFVCLSLSVINTLPELHLLPTHSAQKDTNVSYILRKLQRAESKKINVNVNVKTPESVVRWPKRSWCVWVSSLWLFISQAYWRTCLELATALRDEC